MHILPQSLVYNFSMKVAKWCSFISSMQIFLRRINIMHQALSHLTNAAIKSIDQKEYIFSNAHKFTRLLSILGSMPCAKWSPCSKPFQFALIRVRHDLSLFFFSSGPYSERSSQTIRAQLSAVSLYAHEEHWLICYMDKIFHPRRSRTNTQVLLNVMLPFGFV